MDDNYQENNFEKFPGNSGEVSNEQLEKAAEWENSMSDAPEFAGEEQQFGIASETNEFYGEAKQDEEEAGEEFNSGISDASAIINFGLNSAATKYGIENVVQKLKGFDTSGSEDPIGDFYNYLGVDTIEERKDLQKEAKANSASEFEFRDGPNQPSQNRSISAALAAIEDMKELIGEVESADPRYAELRQGAKEAGMGVFEFAVKNSNKKSLTELFSVLASQREQFAEEQEDEEPKDTDEKEETESAGEKEDTEDDGEKEESEGEEDSDEIKNPKSEETKKNEELNQEFPGEQ